MNSASRGGPRPRPPLPPWFRPRLSAAIVFAFLVGYGILLFAQRPDPTAAQLVFRAVVVAGGLAGLAWLWATRR